MRSPTTVTWTLEPVPEGTRVHLVHAGFTGSAVVLSGYSWEAAGGGCSTVTAFTVRQKG